MTYENPQKDAADKQTIDQKAHAEMEAKKKADHDSAAK